MNSALRPPAFNTPELRWAAVQARDAAADGSFVYAVRSTGVYCRPSCPSRPARQENVSFHSDATAAEAAGFRPCKRCQPQRAPGLPAGIAAACKLIQSRAELPSLAELAQAASLSPAHFQRRFKALLGMTPRQYAAALRDERMREALTTAPTITEAAQEAGFNSSGRFYAAAGKTLGMTPSSLRARGAGERICFALGECSLGALLVAATDKGVCAISLGDDANILLEELQARFAAAMLTPGDEAFNEWMAQIAGFIDQPARTFNVPLDIRGTAFQLRVWEALRRIPAGTTLSYTELAQRLGMPQAVRAVASACAANTLAIAIPCHRIVRHDGGVSGYRWGVDRKRALLLRERKLAGGA